MSHEEPKNPRESLEMVDNETFFENNDRRTRFAEAINAFIDKASGMMINRHSGKHLSELLEAIFVETMNSRNFHINAGEHFFSIGDIDLEVKDGNYLRRVIETGINIDHWKGTFGFTLERLFVIFKEFGVNFNKEKWDELFSGREIEQKKEKAEDSVETDEDMRHVVFIDTSRGPKSAGRRTAVVSNEPLGKRFVWKPEIYKGTLYIVGRDLKINRDILKRIKEESIQGLPANVMDYLVLHPEFIPKEWRSMGVDMVVFPGSIFIDTDGSGRPIAGSEMVGCLELDRDLNIWAPSYRPIVSVTPISSTVAVARYLDAE